jgi:hypothetical protein
MTFEGYNILTNRNRPVTLHAGYMDKIMNDDNIILEEDDPETPLMAEPVHSELDS